MSWGNLFGSKPDVGAALQQAEGSLPLGDRAALAGQDALATAAAPPATGNALDVFDRGLSTSDVPALRSNDPLAPVFRSTSPQIGERGPVTTGAAGAEVAKPKGGGLEGLLSMLGGGGDDLMKEDEQRRHAMMARAAQLAGAAGQIKPFLPQMVTQEQLMSPY